ncbi:hypothetical protein CGI18_07205 [Vibrio parahaemolyticus]|uniref:hypothetical protein n=1 Tax=Vibrio parahaemolyticus TaxID=670 RepID=UPI00111F510C|nr:hypothetical protein [Vibrio parahaemolyticus]TOK48272.1 hypothetical protein CGI18_07205 [Vibrio parahaemolyticus]
MDNITRQEAENKMIMLANDFPLVANYLKRELINKTFHKDEESFITNKIKHDYLTELSNLFVNLTITENE